MWRVAVRAVSAGVATGLRIAAEVRRPAPARAGEPSKPFDSGAAVAWRSTEGMPEPSLTITLLPPL
jgi:hypothetical protein